jgi:sugar/nucleoside kinase (ribokinase family)
MRITITGDLMWYLERPAPDIPARNRTTVLSLEAASLAGSAVNTAVHIALAGSRARLVSLVSAAEKAKTRRLLRERRVDASGLVDHDGFPNLLVAFVDDASARSIFVGHPANARAYRRLEHNLAGDPVCIYSGSRDRNFRRAIQSHAGTRNAVFVFAPSYSIFDHSSLELESFARHADVSIMNREEFGYFARSLGGRRQAIARTRCCIVTLASEGAIVHASGRRARIKSTSGSRKDIIGAGDAFLAGFLTSWVGTARRDPFLAAEAASDAAARYVRKRAG